MAIPETTRLRRLTQQEQKNEPQTQNRVQPPPRGQNQQQNNGYQPQPQRNKPQPKQRTKEEQEAIDAKLLAACAHRDLEGVMHQINAGARITAAMSPENPSNVLHQATRATPGIPKSTLDDPELIEELIQLGANINQRDKEGRTPLYQAVLNRLTSAALVLIRHYADPTIRCNAGRIPLYWAMYDGDNYLYEDLFDAKPSSINERDETGKTSLHWAVECGNYGAIEFLLDWRANVFARDLKGKRPVDLVPAAYNGVGGADKAEAIKVKLWVAMEEQEIEED